MNPQQRAKKGGESMSQAQKCKPFHKKRLVHMWSAVCLVAAAMLLYVTAGLMGVDNHAVTSSVRAKHAQVLIAAEKDHVPSAWKAMTYNIRHAQGTDDKTSLRRIARVIRQERASIIALQEVDRYMWRSGFQDQVDELATELGMNWTFAPSLKIGRFAYGNAILSRYPIVSAASVSLGGLWENRTLLKATVSTERGLIEIYTTHLGLSEKERERQMPLLLRQLDQAKAPALLLGDFNMEASHPLMQQMADWTKLEQTAKRGTIMGNREIDHIYAKLPEMREVQVREVYVPVAIASDHLPVIASFAWETAAD